MSLNRSTPAKRTPGFRPAPAAWRYAVIAAAVLAMCSCQSTQPRYRVATEADSLLAEAEPADDASLAESEPESTARAPRPAPLTPRRRSSPLNLAAALLPEAPKLPQLTERPAPSDGVQPAAWEESAEPPSPAAGEVPQYLTAGQLAASTSLPEGCVVPECGPGDCPCCNHGGGCCNNAAIPGPSDEYLCDGGDFGLPAAVVRSGAITGLEQEDAVAHYDTVDGRTIITPSNQVCIYAPKFAAVRQVVDVEAYERIDALAGAVLDQAPLAAKESATPGTTLTGLKPKIDRLRQPPSLLKERAQAGAAEQQERPAAALGSLAPYCNLEVVRTGVITGEDRVKVARASLAAITWTANQAPQVVLDNKQAHAEVSVQTPGTIYLLVEPNHPKLRLIKLASKSSAQLGEEVEFTLRYDNIGDRVIGNVTIVDHLTTRLVYVPDSQKSSLKAEFRTQSEPNDALTLRWEIAEPLQPGQGGVIQFRTKVR